MRRLIQISVIEAFEVKGVAGKIKDANSNYLHLTGLVAKALEEASWALSRNAKKVLPGLRDVGHMSAYRRYFGARREPLEALRPEFRIAVEEFLHHAGLL